MNISEMKTQEQYKTLPREQLMTEKCFCEGEFVCNRCWAVHDHLVAEKALRKLVVDAE